MTCWSPATRPHGFRYGAIDGRDDAVAPRDVPAVLVRSDLRPAGWFSCSNDDLNRLHEIAVQTWRTKESLPSAMGTPAIR